jgi:hypothetical protein
MSLPDVVFHADWSKDARKRWAAKAVRRDGRYVVSRTEPVPDPHSLIRTLRGAEDRSVFAGFDFPIGVPRSWAERAGVRSFRNLLSGLGQGEWRDFFSVAERVEEIALRRPFFPTRPGGRRQAQLLKGLGFSSMDELLRRCERKQQGRRAACVLFWTLGGNQVGKAAIAGWQDVLMPALSEVALWPFDGSLSDLVGRGVVVAETYPGEVYRHLHVSGRKSVREDRARNASALIRSAIRLEIEVEPELEMEIAHGFGTDDQFDAFVGLLGMIDVIRGRPSGEPRDDDAVVTVEGWILGQAV